MPKQVKTERNKVKKATKNKQDREQKTKTSELIFTN